MKNNSDETGYIYGSMLSNSEFNQKSKGHLKLLKLAAWIRTWNVKPTTLELHFLYKPKFFNWILGFW